ncbi:hypothetical protein QL285_073929 [Trifolium repens]|nr:hypothetical protein QL285_073929 [Trifolium repens]
MLVGTRYSTQEIITDKQNASSSSFLYFHFALHFPSRALSELHHNFNGASIATSSSPERHLHRSFIFSRLEPYVQPTREITKIIKRKFVGCWANYGEIKKKDEVVVELWYKEFQRKYKWLPEMSTTLRRHLIIRLLISWNKDNWKGKSQVNTRNRRSSDGPLHTGG